MNYGFLFVKITTVYFILIVVLRVLGKREVGELSIFDLVVLLIIADIASLGIDNDDFVLPSYFCVLILLIFQKLLSIILLKKSIFRSWIDGAPVAIVVDGKMLIKNMKKEHYNVDDLVAQMRLEHIMDIDEIKLAILETNGTLSIFRTSQFDEVKLAVIISGQLVKDCLNLFEISQKEFIKSLEEQNLNYKKIIYASLWKNTLFYYYRTNSKQTELEGHRVTLKLPKLKDL